MAYNYRILKIDISCFPMSDSILSNLYTLSQFIPKLPYEIRGIFFLSTLQKGNQGLEIG
jgi:hypothetical protein